MTLGNVHIEQIEQERDENGDLTSFTQGQPAYPAVGEIDWDDEGVNVNGAEYKVFDENLRNVIDKIVTKKNTGKSPASVRTIIAIEAPDGDPRDLIHVNVNTDGLTRTPIEIDGVDYLLSVFTCTEPLLPGEISAPSLMQVFLGSEATNEDVALFGDAWEILVASGTDARIVSDGGSYHTTVTQKLNNMLCTSLAQNGSFIVINDGVFTTDVDNAALFFATSNAIIEVNGGFFQNTADATPNLFNLGTNKGNTNRIIFKGGTFVNRNPLEDRMCYTGPWPDSYEQFSGPRMLVWDGYTVVSETQDNGDVWYTIVKK